MQVIRKYTIFIILIIASNGLAICQTTENNCNLKGLKKDFKKSKSSTAKANYALEIADCYRLANDTTYIIWYKEVIETHKRNTVCDRTEWNDESKPIFQIGLSYYWLDRYLQSAVWFEKSIISKEKYNYSAVTSQLDKAQALYYCGKSYYNVEDFQNAKKYLSKYLKIKGDTLDVIQLIGKCK